MLISRKRKPLRMVISVFRKRASLLGLPPLHLVVGFLAISLNFKLPPAPREEVSAWASVSTHWWARQGEGLGRVVSLRSF